MPPLEGEVAEHSEVGGVCPSIERYKKPLSQICRFRSAAKSDSSPFRGAKGAPRRHSQQKIVFFGNPLSTGEVRFSGAFKQSAGKSSLPEC